MTDNIFFNILGLVGLALLLLKRKKKERVCSDIWKKMVEKYEEDKKQCKGIIEQIKQTDPPIHSDLKIIDPWDIKQEDNEIPTGKAIANIVESLKQHKEKKEEFKDRDTENTIIPEEQSDDNLLNLLIKYLKKDT